jgi:hypothetical protein
LFEQDPFELWERYLGVVKIREKKLLDFIKKPRTLEEIAWEWIVYGKPREPKAFYEFGERAHMKKHLEKLMRREVLIFETDHWNFVVFGMHFCFTRLHLRWPPGCDLKLIGKSLGFSAFGADVIKIGVIGPMNFVQGQGHWNGATPWRPRRSTAKGASRSAARR